MALTLSGTNGIVGAGFTVDNSGVSVTAGVGTFSSIGAGASVSAAGLTGALPTISAASLTSIPAANIVGVCTSGLTKTGSFGKILQVVSTTKTDTFSSNSDSFTDLTGLSVTITPTSASNKILFIASLCYGCSADSYGSGQLVRDSTPIGVAGADGSRTVCGFSFQENLNANNKLYNLSYQYLDSPNTTSATTYKLQGRTYTGDSRYFTINRTQLDSNVSYHHRGTSRVMVMEVEA